MKKSLTAFLADEDGAVTVDWVVLTGSVVFLCLAIIVIVGGASENLGTRLSVRMDQVLP